MTHTSIRILVVEDDPAVADVLTFHLQTEGYEINVVADGLTAASLDGDDYDLVLLDVTLPGLSGLEVCRRLRSTSIVPILMLTARTSETDRVLGLEAGADDYLGKPFSMAELTSRVRAILRRQEMHRVHSTVLQVGDLRIDLLARTVTTGSRVLSLTTAEFTVLNALAATPDKPLSRREIMKLLGASSYGRASCDTHIKNLRRKLEVDPAHPQYLLTVRGLGYVLTDPTRTL